MIPIKSMEDLEQARQEALEEQRKAGRRHYAHIRIVMASCSIAAGARDTLAALQHVLAQEAIPSGEGGSEIKTSDILLTQIGCMGLCAFEPIMQIKMHNQPLVTYGKVTPEVARRIIQAHIGRGLVVQEYVVENV